MITVVMRLLELQFRNVSRIVLSIYGEFVKLKLQMLIQENKDKVRQ